MNWGLFFNFSYFCFLISTQLIWFHLSHRSHWTKSSSSLGSVTFWFILFVFLAKVYCFLCLTKAEGCQISLFLGWRHIWVNLYYYSFDIIILKHSGNSQESPTTNYDWNRVVMWFYLDPSTPMMFSLKFPNIVRRRFQ